MSPSYFECVINISEGRDEPVLAGLEGQAEASLRDRHSDGFHNRSVFTLINEAEALQADVRRFLHAAYRRLDLVGHIGVHPRFGVVDVVPYVALNPVDQVIATQLRDEMAQEIADSEGVSIFLYGPLEGGGFRTLPEVRRGAFGSINPDFGPPEADLHKGASAFGARPLLVAWNLWVAGITLAQGKEIASSVRDPLVRTLAFEVGDFVQVSCNFIAPLEKTPEYAYKKVSQLLPDGSHIARAEQVGLAPRAMLELIPSDKWKVLGLSPSTTIESRL
jgi:glutamate formiminotransferase